jgi:hypothetical protein
VTTPSDTENPSARIGREQDALGVPKTAQDDGSFSPEPETTSLSLNGEENEGEAEEGNVDTTSTQRSFGGLTPQEAGRRSAAARAEKARATEAQAVAQSSGKVLIVRTPIQVGNIMARLEVDAGKGNTQSARELREWMREYPAEDETDLSALDRRTRQQVIARVLADIAEDEGALPAGVDE